MRTRLRSVALAGLVAGCIGSAASSFGAERTPRVHALIHARVVTKPGTVLEDATLVLRDGLVVAVGSKVKPPDDARIWDASGRTIYPGFIEPWLEPTPPKPAPAEEGERGAEARRPAPENNPRVHPEDDVATHLALGKEELDDLHAAGYALAHVVPGKGIFRGQSAVVALRDGPAAEQIVRGQAAQIIAFERDPGGGQRAPTYPNSLMGSVALVRQTLLDAGWARDCAAAYERSKGGLSRPESNPALVALQPVLRQDGRQSVWMRTDDVLGVERSAALAKELGLDAVLLGNGDEYRQLAAVRRTAARVVVPLAFPDAPRVDDPDEALAVDFETLRHWEAAPDNPRRLQDAGITFALTSNRLPKRSAMPSRVRTAVEHGLSADVALAALTVVPARWLGLETRAGTIEPGKQAHLTITDGDFFAGKARILEVWVDGERLENRPKGDAVKDVRGTWKLSGADLAGATLRLEGSEWTLRGTLDRGTGSATALDAVRWEGGTLFARAGTDELRLIPRDGKLDGTWKRGAAAPVAVAATRSTSGDTNSPQTASPAAATAAAPRVPFTVAYDTAFAWPPRPGPAPRAVLVRGATVWTSGARGRLENADLLCVGGKVQEVGPGLRAPSGAVVIEAAGKHVTPGLIDCHSHSNILGGVNEATNSCTAEVRIADVLNSESMAIYRELAGGLTTSNQLHGSANAIGGQNAVMKLRWGTTPAGLLLQGAPPGIKFALGENPKQSNWDDRTDRYPQTRMGVEQSIRERFIAARDYMRAQDEWKKHKNGLPPRRDLQLEAVAEILRGERLVHCHSYRADEILMMMRLAESFGFRVATFQHVLEGYKVADEMAAHGAGASSFSDWWAYKFEVYDAVPYNGAILHQRGVVTSYNSDSAELARRLNLEAAKAVRYGGVPETDALQFVTANPAKQLHVDRWVGSLEPGKDADFVVWSDSPLSSAAHCEQTWIDGRRYFDFETDRAARAGMEAERNRLVEAARRARQTTKLEEKDETPSWRPIYWLEDAESCHEGAEP